MCKRVATHWKCGCFWVAWDHSGCLNPTCEGLFTGSPPPLPAWNQHDVNLAFTNGNFLRPRWCCNELCCSLQMGHEGEQQMLRHVDHLGVELVRVEEDDRQRSQTAGRASEAQTGRDFDLRVARRNLQAAQQRYHIAAGVHRPCRDRRPALHPQWKDLLIGHFVDLEKHLILTPADAEPGYQLPAWAMVTEDLAFDTTPIIEPLGLYTYSLLSAARERQSSPS